ncbi:hypothetical protein BDY19DRAFT_910352 [Irpex rosettiformis]|uniref:Uncharacterized protein n=1 Tax=Irpex rosettiformis TaxID=378272 RepID=A0ACB8TP55_9APHY|nr:hypothetical protein BDY19DRAFT_910352 [Irpex rosettiformis]
MFLIGVHTDAKDIVCPQVWTTGKHIEKFFQLTICVSLSEFTRKLRTTVLLAFKTLIDKNLSAMHFCRLSCSELEIWQKQGFETKLSTTATFSSSPISIDTGPASEESSDSSFAAPAQISLSTQVSADTSPVVFKMPKDSALPIPEHTSPSIQDLSASTLSIFAVNDKSLVEKKTRKQCSDFSKKKKLNACTKNKLSQA